MESIQRARLLHWVALAQREWVEFEDGFLITPRWNGQGYRVTLGETVVVVERDGAFEFSSRNMDAVERLLILRLGAEARIRDFTPVLVRSHPGDMARGYQARPTPDGEAVVLLRGTTEVARFSRGTDRYSPAAEFSRVVDADPWELRDSLLDPQGLPLFALAPVLAPLTPGELFSASKHSDPARCPGPTALQMRQLSVANREELLQCPLCGSLYARGVLEYSQRVDKLTIAKARERFPEAVL